jgi:hypothetical protein
MKSPTGRIPRQDGPALQNIPVRTEAGARIREAFLGDSPANADPDNGHEWFTGKEAGFREGSSLYSAVMCKQCGVLRRPDGKSSPCRGKVHVTTRNGLR